MDALCSMMVESTSAQLPRYASIWQNNNALASTPVIAYIAAAPAMPTVPANPSPLLALALREDSLVEADWMWYAKRMIDQPERLYCERRAEWIRSTML